MFWYVVFFVLLVLAGCLVIMKWHTDHKVMKWFAGIVLILAALCVLMAGSVANDWSADSDNWNDISAYKDHVEEECGDIKNIYTFHGALAMRMEDINFSSHDMSEASESLGKAFHYAKKTKLAKKGLFLYQKNGSDGWFIIYYDKNALKHAPSTDDMNDDPDVLLTHATSYRLSDKSANDSSFTSSIPNRSKNQPKIMADFGIDRVTSD